MCSLNKLVGPKQGPVPVQAGGGAQAGPVPIQASGGAQAGPVPVHAGGGAGGGNANEVNNPCVGFIFILINDLFQHNSFQNHSFQDHCLYLNLHFFFRQ